MRAALAGVRATGRMGPSAGAVAGRRTWGGFLHDGASPLRLSRRDTHGGKGLFFAPAAASACRSPWLFEFSPVVGRAVPA